MLRALLLGLNDLDMLSVEYSLSATNKLTMAFWRHQGGY